MTPTIYGIKTCDTMRKARAWLVSHGVDHVFHDYRTDGIDRARIDRWAEMAGWETLLNRASTTFRDLGEADRRDLDADRAAALMLAQPTVIKRPVLDIGDRLIVGFRPEIYAGIFS